MVDGEHAVFAVKVVGTVRDAPGPGDEQLSIAACVWIVVIAGGDEQVYSCRRYLNQSGALFTDHGPTVTAPDLD
jgi:hypothetical protein